jgi:hypothetical protein
MATANGKGGCGCGLFCFVFRQWWQGNRSWTVVILTMHLGWNELVGVRDVDGKR